MKTLWLCALPLALAALAPASADAFGRGQNGAAALVSAETSADGYGTYAYADVLKPHGRERGEAAEQLATRICDAGNPDAIATAKFNACMSARGWRLDHFAPDAPGTYIYADVLKPRGRERGDAARQSATNICDRRDSRNIGLPAFDACMLAHGWRFVASVSAPPSHDAASQDAQGAGLQQARDDEQRRNDDEQRRNDDMVRQQAATDASNAAAQQQFNDGMAAAQQQANQANFIQQ